MAKHLSGDRRTIEFKVWSRWISAADKLARRFSAELEDDPFAYNETASVSALCAAAGKAGLLSIAEYGSTKGRSDDRRYATQGRCDMWLAGGEFGWAIEFKQVHAFDTGIRGLLSKLKKAEECARCLRKVEGKRVAALVVSLYFLEEKGLASATAKLKELVKRTDYAWKISGAGATASGTYLFFSLVD